MTLKDAETTRENQCQSCIYWKHKPKDKTRAHNQDHFKLHDMRINSDYEGWGICELSKRFGENAKNNNTLFVAADPEFEKAVLETFKTFGCCQYRHKGAFSGF